jgi:hypothetical protein
VFLLWAPVCPPALGAESITSPLNGKVLEPPDTPQEYSFLCAGHVYGAHSPSAYPAASFLANINKFNAMDVQFFVMLGDITQRCTESEIDIFNYTIGNSLKMPIFNARGNHDVGNRDLYSKHFGKTYFSFRYCSEWYIFLDTEINDGQVEGEQLEFLLNSLNETKHSDDIKNIFIFSHRLLWAIDNKPVDKIIPWVNGPSYHPKTATSFKEYILPELFPLSNNKNIYLMSGDIGCEWSFPLFYEENPKHNITYIACGLGESRKDAIIKVDITRGGEVTFTPISLTGEKLEEIKHYDIDYWATYFGERNKLSAQIQKLLTNIYFRLGIVFSFTLIGGLILFIILFNKLRKR